ncbi:MAG: methyltransferase dimerization domain-containing protein [Paludibaculum sp.]
MAHADPSQVLDLIDAFRRSKTMFTAVSLGIFDQLHHSAASSAALAVELNLHPGALARLLDGCVGLGLLTKSGDLYFNTQEAEVYLRRESPDTLSGYILYSDQVLFQLWSHLDDAVREGTHRWDQSFGGKSALSTTSSAPRRPARPSCPACTDWDKSVHRPWSASLT